MKTLKILSITYRRFSHVLIVGAILFSATSMMGLYAQETITVSGGNASGNGGTSSYTLGQIAFQYLEGPNGSVTEGMQQPYEISLISAVENVEWINLSVSAYPNPTSGMLILAVECPEPSIFNYQLIDIDGKLLRNSQLTGNPTTLDMSSLAPATYFLKVIRVRSADHRVQSGKNIGHQVIEVKTFKIIKTW